MRDVRKYEVFRLADQLVLDVYRVTAKFPKSEMFGLTGQMRRAAASIPMNLAEGAARAGAKEFAQFVNVAVGSCEEVRYQLHLAEALDYLTKAEQQTLDRKYESVKKMLAKLYGAVSRKPMADVLGQVYEQFLGKVIRLTAAIRPRSKRSQKSAKPAACAPTLDSAARRGYIDSVNAR